MKMNVIINLIATVAIVFAAGWLVHFVWTKQVDWKELLTYQLPKIPTIVETPHIEYGLASHPNTYQAGIQVHDVTWRKNYSYHTMSVVNSSDSDLKNIILSLNLPGAIVSYKQESAVNTHGVSFSKYAQPIEIRTSGKATSRIENTLSNSMDISVREMNKHSMLTIGLVLDYRRKPAGHWQFDVSFEYATNKDFKRERAIHPIEIIAESPLNIRIDQNRNFVNQNKIKATMDMYPMNPIISKKDGRFIQLENFNGDIDAIKTESGDCILFSQGFDFEVNTAIDFKQ